MSKKSKIQSPANTAKILENLEVTNQKNAILKEYENKLRSEGKLSSKYDPDENGNKPVFLPSGKYEGHLLSTVPENYLRFCIGKFNDGKWKTVFIEEIERRNKINGGLNYGKK